MASTNFVVSPSYEDRLTAIGENSIKIRNATRSDAGTYTLVLTSGSTLDIIEFLVHLEVLVSPSDQCTLTITREGDSLMAELPLEGCGSPRLYPRWINRTTKLIGNIDVLKLDPGMGQEIYIVCAVGESRRCFQGDAKHLCANYTELGPKIEREPESVKVILMPVLIVTSVIAVSVILAYYLRRKWNQWKSAGLTDIKRHLINQYKTMKRIALSPSGKENFVDVSEVYCDLEITSARKENLEYRGNVAFQKDIFCTDKKYGNTAENVQPIPAVILGQCGIGKSTWCKNLVHEWCNYHRETNLKVEHVNIPEVAKFEILLFVPLKNKLEGYSFAECLKNHLFCGVANYFEYTVNYILEHGESVLIIIDGLDEVIDNLEPIADLFKVKEEVFPCTIVLTSRPAGLECFLEKEARELRLFQIHGMGLDISQEYVGKVLGIHSRIHHNELTVDQYWNCMRDLQVQSLCQVPFLCLSLILYWLDGTALSGNMTDILLYIAECHIRHAMTRRWFLDNIGKVLEDNYFEISKPIKIIKNKQCLREYGHLLKVISDVAKEIWALQLQKETCVKGIDIVNLTNDIANDCVELCVETGILIKTVFPKMSRERTQIAFSHVLLFDFFVALSLAIGKRDSFSGCLPSQEAVPDNSYISLMLRELTTNNGHIVSSTGDHSAKDNPEDTSKKSRVSNQRSYCNVQ